MCYVKRIVLPYSHRLVFMFCFYTDDSIGDVMV